MVSGGRRKVVLVKTKLLVTLAILVSLAIPGCTGSTSHSQTSTTQTNRAPTKTISASGDHEITLAVGDTLKVTLSANHSTPMWWAADAQIGDPTIVQQSSHEYVAGNTTGGPGTEVWTFKALKAGVTTITNKETDVTNRGSPPQDTLTVKVTVQ
jgi:inhibitor of cysteine peptidase